MPAIKIERPISFGRQGQGRVMIRDGLPAVKPAPGRIPRVAKLLALAHRFEEYLRSGQVRDQSDLAALGNVSRARISQIMNLLNLAPDLQEAILYLQLPHSGRDSVILRQLLPIASTLDWHTQRQLWNKCRNRYLI